MSSAHAYAEDPRTGKPVYVLIQNGGNGETHAKCVECRDRGEVVALVKSKKGNWYTCNVYGFGAHMDHVRATPWAPHFKTCPARKEQS